MANPLCPVKAQKKRRRCNIRVKVVANALRQVQRTGRMEEPSPDFDPLRECHITTGARIFAHGSSRKADLTGLIFMCNTSMKEDCFRHRIFGLPEAKKHLVAQIRRGMTLFLFDVDLNSLHGIYKASSSGGFNLQSHASSKIYPWQVRFTIYKDCAPLAERVFKTAIKDNYDGNRMIKIELNGEQVQSLVKLFRLPHRDTVSGTSTRIASPVPSFDPFIQSDASLRSIHERSLAGRYRSLQDRLERTLRGGSPPRSIYELTFPHRDTHLQNQIEKNIVALPPQQATNESIFVVRDRRLQEQMERNTYADPPTRAVHEPSFPVRDRQLQQHMEKDMMQDNPSYRAIWEPYFECSGGEVRLPRLPQKKSYHNPLIAKLSVPESTPERAAFAAFPTHGADPILDEVSKRDPYQTCLPKLKLCSRNTRRCIPSQSCFQSFDADPCLAGAVQKPNPYPIRPAVVKLRSGYPQVCTSIRASFQAHAEHPILGECELYKTDPDKMGLMEETTHAGNSKECSLGSRVEDVGDQYMYRLQSGPVTQERVLDKSAFYLYPLSTRAPVQAAVSSETLQKRSLDETCYVNHAFRLLSEKAHMEKLLPESIAYVGGVPY